MLNANRISEAQHAFLRGVRDGVMTLSDVKAIAKLSSKQWARWMRNPAFRAALNQTLKEACRHRFVELEMAANVAAEMLRRGLKRSVTRSSTDEGAGVTGEEDFTLSDDERSTCATVIELAHKQRYGRPRRKKSRKPRVDPRRELCHPSVRDRRAELLMEMKVERSKGRA